jgi:hypothetical protein
MTRRQFDLIASQRIRRTLTFIRFYGQLWREDRLKTLISRVIRIFFARVRKRHMLGLTAFTATSSSSSSAQPPPSSGAKAKGFNWDASRIPDSVMEGHRDDINYIGMLREKTLTCKKCSKRHVIESKVESIDYCKCGDAKTSVYGVQSEGVEWTPFLEKKDILIWRQVS